MPKQWQDQQQDSICVSTAALAPPSVPQLVWFFFHHQTHGHFHYVQQHLSFFQCNLSHPLNHSMHSNDRAHHISLIYIMWDVQSTLWRQCYTTVRIWFQSICLLRLKHHYFIKAFIFKAFSFKLFTVLHST